MAPKKITPAKAAAAEPVAVVEAVVEEPVVDANAPAQAPDALQEIVNKVNMLFTLSKEITLQLKSFQKDHAKLVKASARRSGPKVPRKTPSGFAKPAKLNADLCAFLGLEAGSELARTEVTRKLNIYIKEHNLQNPENKKQINPDDKLKELLNLKEDDVQLSYFNLQRFMKHLFI